MLCRISISALLFSVVVFAAEPEAQSEWVHTGADGKLVYKTTPAGDRIMDFSHAGYMGGGVALPNVTVKKSLNPTGAEDETAAIQGALDALGALPFENGLRGALLLGPGTFKCAGTITISASGVVLRGSGSSGDGKTTLLLTGKPHNALAIRGGERAAADGQRTGITDAYVPSGALSFSVADASGFAASDTISIRRPVTQTWVRFMGMDDMTRDGKAQTWIRAGTTLNAERKITKIAEKTITLDVPLSDSYDSKFLNPPGTTVVKIKPSSAPSQCGIESLHIESPPQPISHTQPHFTALRIGGQDSWVRDVIIDETMNSVSVNGHRVTLERVTVNRKALHQGSSRPAEFAPNGTQVLLDRCAVNADNVWFVASGGGVSGPVVLLNCTFKGKSRAESHQRWSTGMLYDNCIAPEGGFEFRNRGAMGSGHGWSMGWGVMWNCEAIDYIVQNPPGATNWLIGATGHNKLAARPFGKEPNLPAGTIDSNGTHVTPKSLYLAQLAERLGAQAAKNIGY